MKKNMVRILAFVLVLILALGIIPLGVFAIEPDIIYVQREYYDITKPSIYDYENNWTEYGDKVPYLPGETIKISDYNSPLIIGDKMYDFAGFDDLSSIIVPGNITTPEEYDAWAKNVQLPFYKGNINIPKDMTSEEGTKFKEKWGYYEGETWIYAGYTAHQHSLSYWYADNTTHWRECLVCKKFADQGFWEQFMFQNWHSDGDEDRVCDVCGHDIPYHEIDVEEVKGGKITVELDEAPYRKKIVATAEPEEGYKLKKIHFIKVRDNGTEQEITRRKTSTKGTWWTYMPTYDLKVTAEFVKKN